MPLFLNLFFFIQYRRYIHTIIHSSFINIRWGPSPYLHSCRLSGRNLHGVPSRDSNPGLPYSKPARYQLSHAAPKLSHAAPWVKRGLHPPSSPIRADFTITVECMPESNHCHSVCTLCAGPLLSQASHGLVSDDQPSPPPIHTQHKKGSREVYNHEGGRVLSGSFKPVFVMFSALNEKGKLLLTCLYLIIPIVLYCIT
jgi:hypothetical protein